MNQAVQSFVKKPTSALANLWSKLNTPPKYRVGYESKLATSANQNKTIGKATTDHDTVEEGLNGVRENLDQVFSTWLESDREKDLTIQVIMKAGNEAQSLLVTLPSPASFNPNTDTPVQ